MGLRRSFWISFFGVPHGPIGRIGARLMPTLVRPLYTMIAGQLDLEPEDELLDVGCGSARLLDDHAGHVRHVAGLDASGIQVGMARRRLAGRIAAGTAEIVEGSAVSLPWEDGRFSVVSSLNCLKFVPDPPKALREMHRVLRPGGRLVLTLDDAGGDSGPSGRVNAFGEWEWSAEAARRMMEEAGFTDVSVGRAPTRVPLQLVRGRKHAAPSTSTVDEIAEGTEVPALAGSAQG